MGEPVSSGVKGGGTVPGQIISQESTLSRRVTGPGNGRWHNLKSLHKVYFLDIFAKHLEPRITASTSTQESKTMEAIFAGAAFIGLFSLWVIVPKMLLKK